MWLKFYINLFVRTEIRHFRPCPCVLSLDSTKILSLPQNVQVISGTTAQLMCQVEYDKTLQDTFEVVWRKDGEEIQLSTGEDSR